MRKDPASFSDVWQEDTERWMLACKKNLTPGGRAAVVIGDGDARFINCLDSIRAGADKVGLKFLAAATISSTTDQASKQRPEHAILLENEE